MSSASKPLSLLHVLAPARVGGLESVVSLLSAAQVQHGHSARVAAVVPRKDDQHPLIVALQSGSVPTDQIVVSSRGYFRERAAVADLCRRHHVQVLHTHGYRPDVMDAAVGKRNAAATVTTVHGFTGGGLRNRLYEHMQVRAFRNFDAVVAVSEPLRELLAARGVPETSLHVIPNAYEPPPHLLSREDARARLGLPPHARVMGWVGRLAAEKGADVFIEALAHLDMRAGIAAVIGDGPERTSLEARAASLGVSDRVRWLGMVPDAARLYRAFDLFVLSSRTEGTPMSLLEAMASGVPCVVTAVGGIPKVVSEHEAWLVPSESPTLLANAIGHALSDSAESGLRAGNARARLQTQFAIDPWCARYDEVYSSAIG